ncbi:hypothetical protein [Paenibacillus sp. SI8]|uniref:hypothetical protein n=1 Tax=unclassified Paenibacillus TaxID=185978 RepID=UPI003467894A
MNRKLWIRVSIGLLLGAILIISYMTWGRPNKHFTDVWHVVQPTITPPPSPTPSEPAAAAIETRLNEIRQWKTAEHQFTTDTNEPLILLQNEKQVVYIHKNQIRYDWIGGSGFQNIPLSFPAAREGYVWRNGKTAFIGLSTGGSGNRKRGDWYEINLTTLAGNPLKRVGDMQLAPDGVQAVTFSNKPAGALFLEKTAESYQEYWISAQGKGQFFVNDYSSMNEPGTNKQISVIDASQTEFASMKEFNNVFVLEDKRGLIVYQNGPMSPSIFRLSGYKLGQSQSIAVDAPLRSQPPYAGSNATLIEVKSLQDDSQKGILLPANNPTPFTLTPHLMEEGWTLVDAYSFIRIQNGKLQTVSYPINQGKKYPEAHEAEISLPANTTWTRQGIVLQAEKNKIKQYLAINDVMNTRLETADAAFWMNALQPGHSGKEDKQEAADKEININFPVLPTLKDESARDDSVPEGMRNALKQRDYMGSGDFTQRRVIRQTGGDWYVLTDEKLERWDLAMGLKEVGHWPVKSHCSTSNYVICDTASDFMRVGSYWYVADTFNNRILQLNDAFEIVRQSAFILPTALVPSEDGQLLRVEGLEGIAQYNQELEQLSKMPAVLAAVGKLPKEELAVWPEGVYEDPNGLQWVYKSNRLYVYDADKQTCITHFIGALTNLAGRAKLIPFRTKMALVLDDRIQLFDSRGNWLKQISFPRTQPDGIYVSTPKGENSMVMDSDKDQLYMIQGYRLLRIDLNSGTVTPLLWQINTNMSKLLTDRGKLYVTLQTGNGYDTPDAHNELIACDTKTGSVTRYKIPEGYTASRITKEHELVLIMQAEPGSAALTSMMYKLNEHGIPE